MATQTQLLLATSVAAALYIMYRLVAPLVRALADRGSFARQQKKAARQAAKAAARKKLSPAAHRDYVRRMRAIVDEIWDLTKQQVPDFYKRYQELHLRLSELAAESGIELTEAGFPSDPHMVEVMYERIGDRIKRLNQKAVPIQAVIDLAKKTELSDRKSQNPMRYDLVVRPDEPGTPGIEINRMIEEEIERRSHPPPEVELDPWSHERPERLSRPPDPPSRPVSPPPSHVIIPPAPAPEIEEVPLPPPRPTVPPPAEPPVAILLPGEADYDDPPAIDPDFCMDAIDLPPDGPSEPRPRTAPRRPRHR